MLIALKKYFSWFICISSIIFVALYWSIIASDQYLSKSTIVLDSPQSTAPSLDFSSLINGSGGSTADMLILREYLLSVDMLNTINEELEFVKHYSDKDIDFISRLSSKSITVEELHRYYLTKIIVEMDHYSKVLKIKVTAFSPEMAKGILELLLISGEKKMNTLGQHLADEQVAFLDKQVSKYQSIYKQARDELLNYQNREGLISPEASIESIMSVITNLELRLAVLNTTLSTQKNFLSPHSPQLKRTNNEITAVTQQINSERSKLVDKKGIALNVRSSKYKALELKNQFAKEAYSGALIALESTRINTARKLKQISILQYPTLPEYSEAPKRLYNITMYSIISLFLTLILQMLMLIIRDHRD